MKMTIVFMVNLILGLLFLCGCANVGGARSVDLASSDISNSRLANAKFSENPNLPTSSQKHYRRMTKQKIEEDADLSSQAGSMWVMEGQNAYLFSQNKARKEGDLLNIKVEGSAQKQIQTKVAVIKKLVKQLEEDANKANLATNMQADPGAARAPAGALAATAAAASADDDKAEMTEIQVIPTRIIERQADGNYRIKGAQPFMIGKREYKVILTGMVRPEDFNDDGISANKLLDPQYDVVNLRRKE